MPLKIYNLYYCRLLSLPLIGAVLYRLQSWGVGQGYWHHGWVSARQSPARQQFWQVLRRQSPDVCFCQAWQLGHQLQELALPYVLEYRGPRVTQLPLAQLYNLQWALILAQSVTHQSLTQLAALLPSTFPIWQPYLVSVQQPLDTPADFVKQTILTLHRAGRLVLIGRRADQPATVEFAHLRLPTVLLDPPSTARWVPYPAQLGWKKAWQWWQRQQLDRLQRQLRGLIFWSFDPDDWQRLAVLPAGTFRIYDCVDYFSSRDPTYQQQLQSQQRRLINQVELMVVNSQTLAQRYRPQRPDVKLVAQGFDRLTAQQVLPSHRDHRSPGMVASTHRDSATKTHALPRRGWQRQLWRHRQDGQLIVTYLGVLSHRVDYPLLAALIAQCPTVTFCLPRHQLAWPVEDQHCPWHRQVAALRHFPNICWYPTLNRAAAFRLLSQSDLGLIPYDLNLDTNRYCFPMKLLEYFWAGLPTLATPLLELKQPAYQPYVRTGRSVATLVRQLRWWQDHPLTPDQVAAMRALAASHDWPTKISTIEQLISQRLRRQLA